MPAPDDLALIEQAAREAGAIAKRYFGGHYKTWDKGKGQPVTDADIEIDTFLNATLLKARSDYGWLSEETRDDPARVGMQRVFVRSLDRTHPASIPADHLPPSHWGRTSPRPGRFTATGRVAAMLSLAGG